MKKYIYIFAIFIAILFFYAVYSMEISMANLPGTYVGNFSNNRDTIVLFPDKTYTRSIKENDGDFIYKDNGKYKIIGEKIIFYNFLINDNDLTAGINYNPDFKDFDLGTLTVRYSRKIFVGEFLRIDDEYSYEKLQNY